MISNHFNLDLDRKEFTISFSKGTMAALRIKVDKERVPGERLEHLTVTLGPLKV